ncbi:malate dehydrogenase (oxaloacetate-decarboxylating) [Candidatus Caldarchaeum subterraneum]|uniref:Malate dehydrogenase (Oxaloacetate-decarboxylating) n=2 Tax=Thermoproteati TaxID=1783275 RepID=E6NB75_CALS0|nr:malate dehydrogenase (oxaloacetate-decarboxylating) [Candidatus Caldarchaeum subterraneum]BAJ49581.1 malate dehydrogenase (oxaloacetate-decarboxylating) [Candidatus Caldarchaeum subterraneum]BAJ51056.1 malate dehydrogenase (oxaloacetate-decarboxylating) [Candidatus Caldarchaeum subterraneum]GBC72249.1 NAD-dependent malic enzyme [archaeon HR03]
MSDEHGKLAVKSAPYYGGKLEIVPKIPVKSLEDFSVWYTPGVAAVSKAISENKELSFEYTWRWNTIAVVTNGSRVLGLGDIGPEAALPVMEGKSLIFKFLGGVDAFPICLNVKDPQKFVEVVKTLEPGLGGINLEDISSPECFYILENLRQQMSIPVWHDDQLGTAAATTAALINALKLTNKKLNKVSIVLFGAGAANIATARLLEKAGADISKMMLVDTKGILYSEREDMDELMLKHPWKYELALKTNRAKLSGQLPDALEGADVLIAASTPGPGRVKKEWIQRMAQNPVVFLLANPVPEMWPWEAKEAGAAVVATGRSDFPNQVNNSLVFPAVFRGALDVKARTITDTMALRAAQALAEYVSDEKLHRDHIIPTMDEWEVYIHVAASVAEQARDENVARNPLNYDEEFVRAKKIIQRSRKLLMSLMDQRFIKPLPKVD